MKVGLRIDVDTYRGTRKGVPQLCDLLKKHRVKGSFFFSVGPDNMGRHLWRLLKPAFLIKMLRSNAASLYGWDILLRGTFFQGPIIGKKCAAEIVRAKTDGHEIGLHAWDHHAWQSKIDRMDEAAIFQHLEKGVELLTDICGESPICSATPGWKTTSAVLRQKERFDFQYNSDCRGSSVFLPNLGEKTGSQPQVPVTLPTYDEVIGQNGISNENYNEHIFSLLQPDQLNVLTIHAEVEGIVCASLFDDFLTQAKERNIEIVPLSACSKFDQLSVCSIQQVNFQGREGWIAVQTG